MAPEAIVFDLFCTLVGFSFPEWDAFGAGYAPAKDCQPDFFIPAE